MNLDAIEKRAREARDGIGYRGRDVPYLVADVLALVEVARAAENLMDNVFDAHDRDPRWALVPVSSLKRVKDAIAKREAP